MQNGAVVFVVAGLLVLISVTVIVFFKARQQERQNRPGPNPYARDTRNPTNRHEN